MLKNLFYIIAGFAIGFLLCRLTTCNHPQPCPELNKSTKADTTHERVVDTSGWYVPNMADPGLTIDDGTVHGPSASIYHPKPLKLKKDSGEFNSDFDLTHAYDEPQGAGAGTGALAVNYYSDTSKTKYGNVIIQDTVEGIIKARRVITDFKIPIITRTVTVSKKERNQVYFGLGGGYNAQDPELYVGPSLMLKTKKDHVFEVGSMINTKNQWMIQASMKFKIVLIHH
jgi:hypothetical protein